MQLSLTQLSSHLKQAQLKNSFAAVYLISGDVPLLVQEAQDSIVQIANQAGFQLHERFTVETAFNWSQLTYSTQSLSLFSEKTLILLHNPKSQYDQSATKALTQYCQSPPPDKILVIISGKLTSAQQKTAWHQAIAKVGVTLPIWPITHKELPQWLQTRLQQAGFKADSQSIQLLAEWTEGNLLASQQAIEKLKLLHPQGGAIDLSEIRKVMHDNPQFNIFELGNYMLQGNAHSVLRALKHLQSEGAEPILVLWLLARELRTLIRMQYQLKQGITVEQILAKEWSERKLLYKTALNRLSLPQLKQLLPVASDIDKTIKGLRTGDSWELLTGLSLALSGN